MIKAQHEMYSTMQAIRRLSRNSCTFTTNVKMRNPWERQRVHEQQIHTATAISQRHCGIFRDESRNTNTRRRLLRETRSAHDAYYTVMISNPELFSGTCDHRGTRQRDAMTSTGHAALGCVRNYLHGLNVPTEPAGKGSPLHGKSHSIVDLLQVLKTS